MLQTFSHDFKTNDEKHNTFIHATFQINNIHQSEITSLLSLSNGKIVSGGSDGSIYIGSLNYINNSFNSNINKQNAHNGWIISLCEIHSSLLISGGQDSYIKIWNISPNELTLLTILNKHTKTINKIIYVHKNNDFISCSDDHTINIWNSIYPFNNILTLQENKFIWSLKHLNSNNNILIANCIGYLSFWNLKSFVKETVIKGVYTGCPNGIIELQKKKHVVVSLYKKPFYLVVIDVEKYIILTKIKDNKYIPYNSSLCPIDEVSFVFIYKGCFVIISYNETDNSFYKIDHKIILNKENFDGYFTTVVIENGQYLLCNNKNKGIGVIKIK